MARRIGLVAAAKARRGGILRARDQYDLSPVFRRARDYCERGGMEWYILSGSHFLLPPHQVIGPDDAFVHALSAEQRADWATEVTLRLQRLRERSGEPLTFTLLASQRYADLLLRAAPDLPLELPLSGLDLASRLRWFDRRLQVRSRLLGPHPQR
ncbi:MAG TPA: hypothetical protein VF812_16460 [Ktedonobacterales bacterium]